ncbi:MAG: hypothetical protein AUG49_13915 [Catenulispora sp. 13_1_20CM_3_70_7]|nr:MAG: hypothetical protein AUG49_13915 [Catenulispora sp. 13_1_20CM_3_70_7]
MTDPQLALRAEQAYIGALLSDPRLIRDPHNTTPSLKHPTHQAIARHIDGARMYLGALDNPARLIEDIAERLNLPGVDADYLHGLARACPDPADVAVYARMVAEAQVRRTLASYAAGIDFPTIKPGHEPEPGYLTRLGQALRRQASFEQPDIPQKNNPAPAPYVNTATAAIAEPAADQQPPTRARREELVLADLIQHRGQLAEVEWLSPEVFAPGPRREIYETILTVDSYGEPVSELTIEWELDRRRNQGQQQEQPEPDRDDPATRPDYIARLAVTAVAVGAAVEIGSQLLEDSLRITLAAEAAKILIRGSEPTLAAEATATAEVTPTATAAQPAPAAPTPQALVAPPPTPTSGGNQPDIRP